MQHSERSSSTNFLAAWKVCSARSWIGEHSLCPYVEVSIFGCHYRRAEQNDVYEPLCTAWTVMATAAGLCFSSKLVSKKKQSGEQTSRTQWYVFPLPPMPS